MSSESISTRTVKQPILNSKNYLHWIRNYAVTAPGEFDDAGEYLQTKELPDYMTKSFQELHPNSGFNKNDELQKLIVSEYMKQYMKKRDDFKTKSKRLMTDIIAHMPDEDLFSLKQDAATFKEKMKSIDVIEFINYVKLTFSSQETNTLWDDVEHAKDIWKNFKQFDGVNVIPFTEFNVSWKEKLDILQDLLGKDPLPFSEISNVYIKAIWHHGISQPLADLRASILAKNASAPKNWEETKLRVKHIIKGYESIAGKRVRPTQNEQPDVPVEINEEPSEELVCAVLRQNRRNPSPTDESIIRLYRKMEKRQRKGSGR